MKSLDQKTALLAVLAGVFVLQFFWIIFLMPAGAFYPVKLATTHATDSGNISLCFNAPPEINQTANITVAVGQNVVIQVNASDPNPGTVLTFSDNTTLFNISSAGIINFTTNASMVGNHTVRITVADNSGCANAAASMEFVIEVSSKIPSIFNERNGTVTDTSAVILWDTDVLANSTVIFGVNASNLANVSSSSSLVINHTLTLTGLAPNTTYFYNVSSCNIVGCNQTGTFNFTTAVTAPPPICGNFITEPPEECDDGDTQSNDGCDFACRIEAPPAGGGGIGGCADGLKLCYDWSPCDIGGRQFRVCTYMKFTCGEENRTEIRRCLYTPPPALPAPPAPIILPPIIPPVAVPISQAAICQFLDTLLPLLIALFGLMTLAAAKRKKQQKLKREENARLTLGLLIIATFLASILFCGTTPILLLMALVMALLFFAYRKSRA